MGAARSIGSATLVIGHARLALKLFTAASAKRVSFNRLHAQCGSRVTQGLRCANEDKPIASDDLATAFEYERDKYVKFTAEEIKAIEASLDDELIELTEFVPAASVDPIALHKAYLLGPDKGGASDYRIIAEALRRRRLAGVGVWGKEIAVVRAFEEGLIVHTAYFSSEVRTLDDVLEERPAVPIAHVKLAENLFTLMGRESFDASRFTDRYAEKIAEAVKQKVAGKEIVVPPLYTRPNSLRLIDALEVSLAERGPSGPAKAGARGRRRKAA